MDKKANADMQNIVQLLANCPAFVWILPKAAKNIKNYHKNCANCFWPKICLCNSFALAMLQQTNNSKPQLKTGTPFTLTGSHIWDDGSSMNINKSVPIPKTFTHLKHSFDQVTHKGQKLSKILNWFNFHELLLLLSAQRKTIAISITRNVFITLTTLIIL